MEDIIKICIEVSTSPSGEFAKLCFEATASTLEEVAKQYAPLIENYMKGVR